MFGVHLPKAPRATASTQASVPPATMTSALPFRMRWKASPIASAPAAQAVAAARFGPRSLCRMLTAPAGEFASIRVTRNGLILQMCCSLMHWTFLWRPYKLDSLTVWVRLDGPV